MITTVTLNASIDKAYELVGQLEPGTVMRVKETRNTAGGKGLNVARVVKLCQLPVLATGLVGGFNGQYLEYLLKKDGIASDFTKVSGETRSCINVLESRFGSTEFLESGENISEHEMADFMMNYRRLIRDTDVVTLSGSLPKGAAINTYATLVQLAKKAGKKVILDSSGESFHAGLKAQPTLVKPNKDELESLFGVKISSIQEVIKYAQKMIDEGIEYVVVSLGKEGAVMLHKGKIYQAMPPNIKPVNTVGCGDSMVGALAVGLQADYTPDECLRYAVAVGTANALSPNTGHFNPGDLKWIYEQTKVQMID